MTTIRLFYSGGQITAVEAKGHTGYAKYGKDIVCAAVSTLIQSTLLGLKEVAKLNVQITSGEGYLRYDITCGNAEERQKADLLLETMKLSLKDIAGEYKSHIRLEETENVY